MHRVASEEKEQVALHRGLDVLDDRPDSKFVHHHHDGTK